ncbi:MAG: hypothetical protein DHS20C02_08590 [Micavibrio sp.]|nr:MAG: hypothetical protein DHS20C02_08590 [Micavibrio sp.]
MNILVVDDNQYVLEVISFMLKEEDYTLETCGSVDEAIEVLEAGEEYGLVITDIVLPEKDGTKLAQYVKDKHPTIPVLAITGGVENATEDYVNYADMFADETMAKPLKKDELITTIKRLAA